MFAASRKLRVNGRTKILVLSISNGLNHTGAPSGRRRLMVFFARIMRSSNNTYYS